MRPQPVALIHRDEILEQVASGAMLKAIANKLGVGPAALSNQLHDDPEYRKAREIGAEVRLEEQYQAITEAEAQEDVSRAREGFRAATWFAEREFPSRWGPKSQLHVTGTVTLDVILSAEDSGERDVTPDEPQAVTSGV